MVTQLKKVLVEKELTQARLAREIGISQTRLSRIVRGVFRARAREQRLIAERLGVTKRDIFPARRARLAQQRRRARASTREGRVSRG